MKKLLSFVLCVVLVCGVSIPAVAVDTAAVDYCRVKIVVDGATIVPKDADGLPVEPFIYKGTTYLPVRSVANALGLEVGWEPGTVKLTSGAERTAAIGKPIESQRARTIPMGGQDTKVTLDGQELTLKDAAGKPVTPIISGGVTYLPVRAIADALNVPVLWDGENTTVYLGKAIEWRLVKQSIDEDEFVIYTYDDHGKLTEILSKDILSSTLIKYKYDGNRVISATTITKGLSVVALTQTMKMTYGEDGQLLSTRSEMDDGTVYETFFTYDERGNQTSSVTKWEDDTGVEERRSYDDFGRLIESQYFDIYGEGEAEASGGSTYTYNENNQILTETECNRIGEETVKIYSYDEYGNLTQINSGDEIEVYEYTPIYH